MVRAARENVKRRRCRGSGGEDHTPYRTLTAIFPDWCGRAVNLLVALRDNDTGKRNRPRTTVRGIDLRRRIFMQFSEHDLRAAVTTGALETNALSRLFQFLATLHSSVPSVSAAPAPQFDLAQLLWYAGALIFMGAMGLFSTLAFSSMGGGALTATAVVYAILFTIAGHHLWYARDLRIPGGLLIAIAVSMAPLALYGIQEAYGMWGQFGRPGTVHDFYVWIKGSWVFMELAAIVAAVIALRFYPFPFIVMIIAFALWFMSMDLTPWIYGRSEFTWEERRAVSVWFGLGVLVVAWLVDRRPRGGDFAF